MGRSIPTDEAEILIHPAVSISLFAAGMAAATFAMITALCSFSRKKAPRTSDDEDDLQTPATSKTKEESQQQQQQQQQQQPDVVDVKTTEEPAEAAMSNETAAPQEHEKVDDMETENADEEEDTDTKDLPLPPGKSIQVGTRAWDASNNANTTTSQMKKSSSERRLLSHLSLRLPRSLSMARKGEKGKEDSHNKHKNRARKLSMAVKKQEESVWMKTIILGEKCKVPDEEDIEIYDHKGRKIPAYHPKSRQGSFIDQSALPNNNNNNRISSRQNSFIDTSAIPDQRRSNASQVEIDRNRNDEDENKKMITADEEELMSLSQL